MCLASSTVLGIIFHIHCFIVSFIVKACKDPWNSENIAGERNAAGNKAVFLENRLKSNSVGKNADNLFKRNLNDAEISLLPKGLNFVPTWNNIDKP